MKTKQTRLGQIVLIISVFIGVIAFGFHQTKATGAQGSTELIRVEMPVEATSLDAAQLEEIAALKGASSGNLDQRLVRLIEWRNGSADRSAPSELAGLVLEGTSVLVEIRANPDLPQLTSQFLTMEGATVRHHNAPGLYEAWVEIASLENLTGHEAIYFIQPARLVKTLVGDSLSQGVARSFANEWHTAGVDGTGVTIAIIDAFNNTSGQVAALQASGDWPPGPQLTTVKVGGGTFGDNGVPHGNAVLEIAYDMAPGATFIAYDTLTVGDWYNAIGLAVAAGADIISASLGAPLDGIGDGSALPGSIAEAAANARTAGVLYVNAAGNSREDHWGGLYNGNGVTPGGGYVDSHDWTPGNNLNVSPYCIPNGYPVQIELFWDDWTNVNHDYDLYLFRWNGSDYVVQANSTLFQDGGVGQTPQEYIFISAAGGVGGFGCPVGTNVFGVMVARWSAPTARNLQLFTSIGLDEFVPGRSLGFPADSPNVMTVAAVDHTTLAQESYSSEGPILAPGGGLPTGTEHPKPDIASYANVDTQSYGSGVFNGTSAATPHVAGWAALILQNNPTFNVAQLEAEMFAIAGSSQGPYNNDLGPAGHDFQYGHGLSRFLFTPTAVSLSTFSANSAWPLLLVIVIGLLLGGTAVVARRKNS